MKKISIMFVAAFGLIQAGCVTSSPEGTGYPDPSLGPTYGTADLSVGGLTTVAIIAGGDIDASSIAPGCEGMIFRRPDYVFEVDAVPAGSAAVIVAAVSNVDTTLVVLGPDNGWYCDDDSAGELDPLVVIPARAGRYYVWVGTYNGGYADAFLGGSLATGPAPTAAPPALTARRVN